jgi:hypothetical protein
MDVRELGNTRCLVVEAGDGPLETADAVLRLFGDAMGEDATTIVVRAEGLAPSFFDLRTGFAGEVLQKAANYRIRFAVVGDISQYVAASKAFHDLVVESENAAGYCFVPDEESLAERLAAVAQP